MKKLPNFLLLSSLLLTFCVSCTKKTEEKVSYFSSDTNFIKINNDGFIVDSLQKDEKILNNDIISSSNNINISSSYDDISVLLKKNSKAGFYQNDSEVFIYLYSGMIRINQKDTNRLVFVNSPNSKKYSLNGGNIILHAYDKSQNVSTTKKGLEVGNEPILLGELFNSTLKSDEIGILDKAFLDSSISWLDSVTYHELEELYVKPGIFPKIRPLIKTAFVNTKLSLKLDFEKRKKTDKIKILNYELPKDAKLKDNKILWIPKKEGKYRLNFVLTDSRDTAISTNFIRISKSIAGKASIESEYLGEQESEVKINMEGIYSKITGSKGLLYKVEGLGSLGKWSKNPNLLLNVKGIGTQDYKIFVKALNGEIHTSVVSVKLNTPPVLSLNGVKKEYYKDTKISLDLSKSVDDNLDDLSVEAKIFVDKTMFKTLNFKASEIKDIVLSKAGDWQISYILTNKEGLQSSEKQNFKVIEKLSINIENTYTVNVNKTFEENFYIKGATIKKISIKFNDSTFYPTSKNRTFKISRLFKKEGSYPFNIELIDDKGTITNFSSKIVVVNMIESVKINVITKDIFVNNPIIFESITSKIDNKISKIRWDFDGDNSWDKELSDGKNVSFVYKKMGDYEVVCEMETNDGQKVRDYKTIKVKNNPPKAIAFTPFAIISAQEVKLVGNATDEENSKLSYFWDIDGDGKFELSGKEVTVNIKKFTNIKLKVMDSDSLFTIDSTKIVLCPSGMRLVKEGLYCIDKYEYPNKKGELPKSGVTYNEAENICKSQGKRLCYEEEWKTACKGRDNNIFSYGNTPKENACNINGQENKITYSGSKVNCVGYYGTYSQNGNVAEWTKSPGSKANVYGGSYFSNTKNSTCDSKITLEKNKRFPYVGFRCCK